MRDIIICIFCIFIPVWFSENKRIQQLLYSSNSVLLVFPLPFWIYDGRSQNDREIQRKSSAAAEDEALWSPSVLLAGTCYSILNCSTVGWFCSWALLKIWDMLWRFSVGQRLNISCLRDGNGALIKAKCNKALNTFSWLTISDNVHTINGSNIKCICAVRSCTTAVWKPVKETQGSCSCLPCLH